MAKPDAIVFPPNLAWVIKQEGQRRHETFEATILRVLYDHFEKDLQIPLPFAMPMDDSEEAAS